MAFAKLCFTLALLVLANGAYGQGSCAASTPGAKYRWQAMIQLKDPTPANLKAADAAVKKWITEDCKVALAFGSGPAISTNSATYGIAAPKPGQEFADHGAWIEFASLDDLSSCYAKGLKSGNLAAIRALSKKASRLVYDLSSAKANSAAGCTAGVRYMFHYLMKDPVNADVCKKANELQAKIVSGPGSESRVRNADGCDVITDAAKVYGAGVPKTADYGGMLDFKNAADMTKYLSNANPATNTPRQELRNLAASTMRVAIDSTPPAAIAKESAKTPGRRFI